MVAAARPRRRRPVPVWRRVVGLADQSVPRFVRLWRRWLREMRRAVRQEALVTALEVHMLEADSLIGQVVATEMEMPAREGLTSVGFALATAAAETARLDMPDVPDRRAGQPFLLPELRYPVEAAIGEEVMLISQTTRQTARQVLRGGVVQGVSAAMVAQEVRATLGLTPRQVRARERLRERLTAEGFDEATIASRLALASDQALQHRTRQIAQTQATAFVQLGLAAAWELAVQRGAAPRDEVRRVWVPLEDPRTCPGCHKVPELNPGGVSMDGPFETAWGPMQTPPAHPACRCSLDYRVVRTP